MRGAAPLADLAAALVCLSVSLPSGASACEPEAWLIRHGDKAASGRLSARGQARAEHLAALVANGTWPRFARVFAVNSHTQEHMLREVETALPMAARTGVTIDERFTKDQEVPLAAAVTAAALASCRPILVVWEHCRIPALAMALGCSHAACSVCWTDTNFGEVLRIDVRTGTVAVGDEEFAGDDIEGELRAPSFRGYECTDSTSDARCDGADHEWHCDCVLPSGARSSYGPEAADSRATTLASPLQLLVIPGSGTGLAVAVGLLLLCSLALALFVGWLRGYGTSWGEQQQQEQQRLGLVGGQAPFCTQYVSLRSELQRAPSCGRVVGGT